MKETIWIGGFAFALMLAFMIFAVAGWPGDPDSCLNKNRDDENKPKVYTLEGNTCYCEKFELSDVEHNRPGVRQPFNTFSNLYALGTALFFIIYIYRTRPSENSSDPNRMRSTSFYPIFYAIVAVFLGLGSMWFHASIVAWGGFFDVLSMYTLVSFLIAYSLVRLIRNDYFFYIGYPLILIGLLITAGLGVASDTMIPIMMVPYGILEVIIWYYDDPEKTAKSIFWTYGGFWWIGLGSFVLAMISRALAVKPDDPLCFDTHAFQFHGLWHWLAGGMALMLFFHWRFAKR